MPCHTNRTGDMDVSRTVKELRMVDFIEVLILGAAYWLILGFTLLSQSSPP